MVLYPRITLWSPRESTDLLPPWPLTRLSLLVEVRTQLQGLGDTPVARIRLSITGLLKPQFIYLPTDQINASLLSFESLLRRIERGSNIKFDAARDELGWVEQPLQLDREKQFRTIVDEITFHNAIGVSQLLTTQSRPPQEIVFHLWSPALKESPFRMSHRAPESQISTSSEKPEAQFSSQQPSSSSPQLVTDASQNRLVEDVSPDLLKTGLPPSTGPLHTFVRPLVLLSISAPSVQAIKEAEGSAKENLANSQWTLSDVVEDPSSHHLLLTATEQSQSNAHSFAHFEPQRNVLDPAQLSGPDLPKDEPITDGAQDQMPGAWGDW